MKLIAEIREIPTGGRNSIMFEAFHENRYVGRISVARYIGKIRGLVVWFVTGIHVDRALHRQGIASALYAAALREVCRRRGHLISVGPRVDATNAFWEKQTATGAAKKFWLRHGRAGWSSTKIVYIAECPPRPTKRTSRST